MKKRCKLLDEEGWKYSLDTGWTNWDLHIFASRWWNLRLRFDDRDLSSRPPADTGGEIFLTSARFSSLLGGLLLTFSLVIMLTQTQSVHATTLNRLSTSFYIIGLVSFLALIWLVHGLRLRHRLAELVEVAAVRAGLQPVGKEKRNPESGGKEDPSL